MGGAVAGAAGRGLLPVHLWPCSKIAGAGFSANPGLQSQTVSDGAAEVGAVVAVG